MNLYIVRHGNPDYMQDCLTELGHAQAEAAAAELETLEIDEIYASTMGRAMETAGHLAKRIGKEIHPEPWAREIEHYAKTADGGLCQLVSIDPSFTSSPEIEAMGDAWPSHPRFNGEDIVRETVATIEQGMADFLRRQGYVLEGNRFRALDPEHPNEKNIALFCHAGSFLVMTAYLLRIPQLTAWHSFFMYQAAYTWCNFACTEGGYAVPRYYAVNQTHHLRAAGLSLT